MASLARRAALTGRSVRPCIDLLNRTLTNRTSCRSAHLVTPPCCRHNSTSTANKKASKPFYITTPIFYVNAKPHVGHLYSLVLTDVIRRHRALSGDTTTCMLTGVDEHGMKIQRAAESANGGRGIDPQLFCDAAAEVFAQLPRLADVHPDVFMRTTSTEHKAAVAHFWTVLESKGLLFRARHSGWYSVSDETFFPESGVEDVVSPDGHTQKVSIETGNVVEWAEEDNWHFKLSAMREPLLELYRENPGMIVPKSRYDEVVAAVEEGLADLSVSRPASRLTWGIGVPGDASQTIYVWLDALINYITACGYPAQDERWPADVHVIGKDIVRFHCIYWPAFLLAAGLPPPRRILSHSHWTLGNLKMSKSRGNVVDPWLALERFGADTMRYYLVRDGRIENDGNYDARNVVIRHNHELANGLGNLVSRLTAPRLDVATAIDRVPQIDHAALTSDVAAFAQVIDAACQDYDRHMSDLYPHRALAAVVGLIDDANALLQRHEPWLPSCPDNTRTAVLALAAEAARCALLMLQPVIPTSAGKLLTQFGVAPDRRGLSFAGYGKDVDYRPVARQRVSKKQKKTVDGGGEEAEHVFSKIDDGEQPIHTRPLAIVQKQMRRLEAMAAHDKLD